MTTTQIETSRFRHITVDRGGDDTDVFIDVRDTLGASKNSHVYSGLTADEAARLAKALLGLPEDAVVSEILPVDAPADAPVEEPGDRSTPATRADAMTRAVGVLGDVFEMADAVGVRTVHADLLRVAYFIEFGEVLPSETKES